MTSTLPQDQPSTPDPDLIADRIVGGHRVSTYALSHDYYSSGLELETEITTGGSDEICVGYATGAEAQTGHDRIVAALAAGGSVDDVVAPLAAGEWQRRMKPEPTVQSQYHTSTHTMATALRDLADRLDRMPGPIAKTYLNVDMQVTGPGDTDSPLEQRQYTIEALAGALGLRDRVGQEGGHYRLDYRVRDAYPGLHPSIYGEMPAPTAASVTR